MVVKVYNPEAAADLIHVYDMVRYGAEILDKDHVLDIANQLEKMGFHAIVVKRKFKNETVYAVWRSLRKVKSHINVGKFGGKPKKTVSHNAKLAKIEREVKHEIAISVQILRDIHEAKKR